jgi:hypothetical protein
MKGQPVLAFAARQGKVTELRCFSARPWTQTDDDKLRALALTGASSRSIGEQMNRAETPVRSRAGRLKIILKKSTQSRPQMG